ncbi:hypothetical protein [Nocardiopsis dassonvillei]|uniref:hypothetical protein n=1 Tax=Nocardiopsis dassonvillei TaxID=2014 RepID=UPI00366A9CAF
MQKVLKAAYDDFAANAGQNIKHARALEVKALLDPTALVARELLDRLWDDPVLPSDVAALIRNELAVLAVLEGRDGLSLRVDILGALVKKRMDVPTLTRVLWPNPIQLKVAVAVHGARHLQDLDQLLPGSQQWALTGSGASLGAHSNSALKGLVAAARAVVGPSVLVQIPVTSSDVRSAINVARRELSETLDQYVAGHRLLSLTLGPVGVAIDRTNQAVGYEERVAGAKEARPLTGHWSMPLRPALRMAHVANQVEAPMASTALVWSALETVGAKDMVSVSKAIALHTTRQQIIGLYKTVANSAIARLAHARWRIDQAAAVLKRSERALVRTLGAVSKNAQRAAIHHEVTVAERKEKLAEAHRHESSLRHALLPAIETVQRNLLGGGDPDHPLAMSSWRLDINGFLDTVLPPRNAVSLNIADSRVAVEVLVHHAGGFAQEQWGIWRFRLADPIILADWLDHQQEIFHGLLKWMYANRNMAFHDGKFSAPADALTAQAARGVADIVLEFLGNWYKTEHAAGQSDSDPAVVIKTIAQRKDYLINELHDADSCHSLDVAEISSPNGDCWNRS